MPEKKTKNKVGRPVEKWTPEFLETLNSELIEYINETDIPILAEFACNHEIIREQLYQYPALSYAIKKCREKKEYQLEKLALKNEINSTMAIFSLKQLGWKDRQEIDVSSELNINVKVTGLKEIDDGE